MASISLPSYEERVLFLGANGSGKTHLATRMLASYPRWIVIDLKGDVRVSEDETVVRSPSDWKWRFADKIIYRPKIEYMDGFYHRYVLRQLYERARKKGRKQPFILYVDESLFLSRSGASAMLANLAVATRSLHMGFWCSSQRPRNIPVEIRTEAWRWYIFYLMSLEDEKEVSRYTKGQLSIEDLEQGTENYSFWEIKRGKERSNVLSIHHYSAI